MNTLQQATTKPTSVMEQVRVYKVYLDSWNCWSGIGACQSYLHQIFGRPAIGPKYTLNTFVRPTPHLMLYRVGEFQGHNSFLCALPLEEEVKSARAKKSIREKQNWSCQKWSQSEWNILTTASRDGHLHTYVHAILTAKTSHLDPVY